MASVETDTAQHYAALDAHQAKYDFIERESDKLFNRWITELEDTGKIEELDYDLDDFKVLMADKGFTNVEAVVDLLAYEETCNKYES